MKSKKELVEENKKLKDKLDDVQDKLLELEDRLSALEIGSQPATVTTTWGSGSTYTPYYPTTTTTAGNYTFTSNTTTSTDYYTITPTAGSSYTITTHEPVTITGLDEDGLENIKAVMLGANGE